MGCGKITKAEHSDGVTTITVQWRDVRAFAPYNTSTSCFGPYTKKTCAIKEPQQYALINGDVLTLMGEATTLRVVSKNEGNPECRTCGGSGKVDVIDDPRKGEVSFIGYVGPRSGLRRKVCPICRGKGQDSSLTFYDPMNYHFSF